MAVKRFLVVDDSRLARMMMRDVLGRQSPDSQVVEAGNPQEALALLERESFDMALLDLNMPGMNGLELASRIQEIAPATRLILVTANIQDQVRQRAEGMGVRFLDKPVNDTKMAALLSA